MKTILLLGAYGFIGTNVIKYIESNKLNYDVITFDIHQHHPNNLSFYCVKASYAGDFSDESILSRIFEENTIDFVIHCISSTVPMGSQSARYDVETNLIPTIQLLDIMVRHLCHRIIFIYSGGAVYGDANRPHKESETVFPISSYGVVKVAIEKILFQYASAYGLKPLVLRLSNPYGFYHNSNRQGIVNVALRSAKTNNSFTVWGDGSVCKDYIYVEDFCKFLFYLVTHEIWNDLINVGSGQSYSVNEILQKIKSYYPKFSWNYAQNNRNDVRHSSLDLTKMHSYCYFKCKTLDEVLPLLVEK